MSAISLTDMSLLDYSSSSIVIQAMEIIESVIDPVSGHTVLTISTVCVCGKIHFNRKQTVHKAREHTQFGQISNIIFKMN